MRSVADSDTRLEADIAVTEDNGNGFQEGSRVPYLNIAFELTKEGGDDVLGRGFHPIMANEGSCYGDNIKMLGASNYHLKFTPHHQSTIFGRHVDQETGAAPWFE